MNYHNNPNHAYYYANPAPQPQQMHQFPPQPPQMHQLQHAVGQAVNNNNNNNPAGVSASSASTRRGPWSPTEDKKLLDLINIFGPTNWVRISNSIATRTPKQCRERYHQNLKPSLNRSPITVEEGELIESLVAKYGKKWAEISRHLNGRSDNAIKNWWNGGANRRRRASVANGHIPSSSLNGTTSDSSSTANSANNSNNGSVSSTSGVPGSLLSSQNNKSSGSLTESSGNGHRHSNSSGTSFNDGTSSNNTNNTNDISNNSSTINLAGPAYTTTPATSLSSYAITNNSTSSTTSSTSTMSATQLAPPVASTVPQVPQLPQISFNTSMFGKPDSANAYKANTPPPSGYAHPNASPMKSSALRSASFDINSNSFTTLPPISSSNKRRLLDDPISRRHSTTNTIISHYTPSHSQQGPTPTSSAGHHILSNSHPNLPSASFAIPSSSASGIATNGSAGAISPSYGSPLLLSSQVSRNNSISHFEFSTLNSTNNSSRRSSSIAPDFFPNPLKELQAAASSLQNKDGLVNGNHKRNISQNSSFNSPSLTPSTRFSISSTTSMNNTTSNSSNLNTLASSTTSPISNYNGLKNEHSLSNGSIHEALNEEEVELKHKNDIDVDMDENDNKKLDDSLRPPAVKTKISVSSLID